MWYQNIRSASFSFVTIHASDGQTDGQNSDSNTVRCIRAYMQSHGKNPFVYPKNLRNIRTPLQAGDAYMPLCLCLFGHIWSGCGVEVDVVFVIVRTFVRKQDYAKSFQATSGEAITVMGRRTEPIKCWS